MEVPLDPETIRRNARALGFNAQQASILTHVALDKLCDLLAESNEPVTFEVLLSAIKQQASEEIEREKAIAPEVRNRGISILDDMEGVLGKLNAPSPSTETVEHDGFRAKRFKFDDDGLEQYFGSANPYSCRKERSALLSLKHKHRDIITALCAQTEMAVELGKQLRPEDLVSLYATSKMFHYAIKEHLLSSVRMWIAYRAPEAGKIFAFKLYRQHLVPDPAGRTWRVQYGGTDTERALPGLMDEVRTIPGLRYLQLVLVRDRCCRQIIAIMARHGFLMPETMYSTLLRLWLVMDIPTSGQRQALFRNRDIWTDVHLYNAQMFFLKLSMLFNDPIYGPFSNELLHVMLGQRGLYPLWQLLLHKRFTKLPEVLALKVRYDYDAIPDRFDGPDQNNMYGVPIRDVGRGHLEGWGLGNHHLQRPDELVPVEAIARGLHLDDHLMNMMTWGYIDYATGENIVPSVEDMYISDEEEVLHNADTTGHWKPKHALKKRFTQLSHEQQQEIIRQDEDDRLRALAWTGDTTDYKEQDIAVYTLDDEINRGYIVPPPAPQKCCRHDGVNDDGDDRDACGAPSVPDTCDAQGWANFVNAALSTVPPELSEEQALRAQPWLNYHEAEFDEDWDWSAWLEQQEESRKAAVAAGAVGGDDQSSESAQSSCSCSCSCSDSDSGSDEDEDEDEDDAETIILYHS
ncbi:hypothetical protein AAL_03778 [Moelleriella libera RCEF 2490]|uniref:Histidine kinase group protein n=1 Tax=Moelleriella libera RCEF 2490 TaxID=1081109 RepID=A0A168CG11_9HYPO|nr:hypothetical protein AAL_03778 [Moelleriella libera RCEF 2490]